MTDKNSSTMNNSILIIEENKSIENIFLSNFTKNDMKVEVINNISSVIDTLELNNYNYDLILLGLDTESLKCLELCRKIRIKRTVLELPIVCYSSNNNSQLESNAFNAGINDFFHLPFNNIVFKNRIKMMLRGRALSDRINKLQNIIDIRTQVFKMNTHDLKNPLSSIFSLSGIPIDSFNDKEEISQTMTVIHNASKIMMSLINNNLEFLNVSSEDIQLEKKPIDVISLINQIVEINNPLAKNKSQKIIYTYPTYPNSDCIILSDNSKMYQAINNIVGNAIKFSPFNKNIWIDVTKSNDKIKIQIKDEGPGFKKDEVDSVLIKFGKHSATPTGDEISTGLGLLITKQIINLSKGEIYLESREGQGATFTLEFPQAKY